MGRIGNLKYFSLMRRSLNIPSKTQAKIRYDLYGASVSQCFINTTKQFKVIKEPTSNLIEVVFSDEGLVLADDIKFKFYCSTVSLNDSR